MYGPSVWVVVAPTARAIPHEIDNRSAWLEEGLDPDRDTFLFLPILTRGFPVIVNLTLYFRRAFGLHCLHPPPSILGSRSPSCDGCQSEGPLPSAEARDPWPWDTLPFCFKTPATNQGIPAKALKRGLNVFEIVLPVLKIISFRTMSGLKGLRPFKKGCFIIFWPKKNHLVLSLD